MPLEVELVLRLLLAAVLAGLIGLEREVRDQPAGFRTHMLVALGACLFTLVSAYSVRAVVGDVPGHQVRFDPSRIAAQIVTGIGFLGAGAIIRYGMSVRGLTTAASLWVVAAIGTAVGFGGYIIASATTAIALLTLFFLRPVRARLVRGLRKEHDEFVVEADPSMDVEALVHSVVKAGMRIDHLGIEEEDPAGPRQIRIVAALQPGQRPEQAAVAISETPGVRNVDWSR